MLMDLFSCCFPRKRPRPNLLDERTYLIPTEPHIESVDNEITRRQRALRGRLTEIVRAKEGKMVNLHVRLPFNLHNRTNSSLSARLDPSSSRSASDSLLALPTPTSPRYPISYAITQQQCHCTPSPGFLDERNSSASRSSSRFDPQHDRSDHDGDTDGDGRLPILNLRLVNPGPTFGVGTSNRLSLNRGRSPLKYATTLEVQDTSKNGEPPTVLSPPSLPPPIPKSDITGLPTQNQEMDRQDMRSPSNTIGPSMPKTSTDTQQLVVSISPASTSSFKIHENSPLVIDWES